MPIESIHIKSSSATKVTNKIKEIVTFLNHPSVPPYKGLHGNGLINKLNEIIKRLKTLGKTINAYQGGYVARAITVKINEIIYACNN